VNNWKIEHLLKSFQTSSWKTKIFLMLSNLFGSLWYWDDAKMELIWNHNEGEDPIAPLISTTRSMRARRGRDLRSAKIMCGFRSSVPRRDADGLRRHSSFLAVWYHVPCWLRSNTHTHAIRDLRIQVELHYVLPYVTAYPVAPHPPTGFVPAPTQPPTYGGKIDFRKSYNTIKKCKFK